LVVLISTNLPRQIANAHTLFNVINTIIFLPFIAIYTKLLTKIIKGKEEEEVESEPKYLEPHLLNTPPIAMDAATKEIIRTLALAKKMVSFAMDSFFKDDLKSLSKITKGEEAVDNLRLFITNYLVELMQRELSVEESIKIPPLIHVINDVERIGDHAENLRDLVEQKIESKLPFSNTATDELRRMYQEVDQMTLSTINALSTADRKEALSIIREENHINALRDELKDNHVKRLEQGICKVLSGVVFLDIISNFEKIADHLNNIAQAIEKSGIGLLNHRERSINET